VNPPARWRWIIGGAAAGITAWLLLRADPLPWFIDHFYHLSVIEGFKQSGGLTLWDWWEFAPAGRPHLYPPLWHLLNLSLPAGTGNPIHGARAAALLLGPLTAGLLWWSGRRLIREETAGWSALFFLSFFPLLAGQMNHPTAALGILLSLVAWTALEQGRVRAAALAFGGLGWSHTGLFLLLALGLAFYGFLQPEKRRQTLTVLLGGTLLAAPWGIHQLKHLHQTAFAAREEGMLIQLPLGLLALAGWGLWKLPRKQAAVPIAWGLGMLPMGIHYPFRLLSGEGLFPLLLLAGAGAADLWKKNRFWKGITIALLLAAPAWQLHEARPAFEAQTALRIAGLEPANPPPTEQTVYSETLWPELAARVRAETRPEELFFCNLGYAAGILIPMTGRAATTGMLPEIPPENGDPIGAARLIVWIKRDPAEKPPQVLRDIAFTRGLEPAGETQAAFLFRNPRSTGQRRIRKAILPGWLGLALIGLWGGFLGAELKRRPAA